MMDMNVKALLGFQWFLNLLVWSSWISFGIILVGVATHLYHVLITLVYLITFKIWLQEKWLACVNLPSSLWGLLWVPLYEWALWNKSFSWYYLLQPFMVTKGKCTGLGSWDTFRFWWASFWWAHSFEKEGVFFFLYVNDVKENGNWQLNIT